MASMPGTVPVVVFLVGIALLALEVVFILSVHHGRTPRRRRGRARRSRA
jgi:uncharacterized membrane protein YecN with MAPEG domain